MFKCSWHTVLTTDWWKSESHLCFICTKKCSKWLAPSFWIFCHSSEVFLICESDLTEITTGSNNLSYRICNSIYCSMIWAPWWKIWIKSIRHHSYCIAWTLKHWKLCNHALCLCKLILTTIWHIYWTGSDRTIKSLNKSLLWAFVKVC